MSKKLCICPGRKCRSLFTPLVQEYVANHLDLSFEQLQDYVLQHIDWRDQQTEEYGKGVKPANVETARNRVLACESKAELLSLMENQSAAMHRKIEENQNNVSDPSYIDQEYDYPGDDGFYPNEYDPF